MVCDFSSKIDGQQTILALSQLLLNLCNCSVDVESGRQSKLNSSIGKCLLVVAAKCLEIGKNKMRKNPSSVDKNISDSKAQEQLGKEKNKAWNQTCASVLETLCSIAESHYSVRRSLATFAYFLSFHLQRDSFGYFSVMCL